MDELEKYSNAGVTSTDGMSGQLGPSSAEVMLTDGLKRRKKHKGSSMEKSDAEGIITTIDGKKIKLTGLTNQQKDEYLFGSGTIKKALDDSDVLIEYLSSLSSPEIEDDFEDSLEKCDLTKTSKLIKNKTGAWRRVAGRPCFICPDGMIHAGPKVFVGKKAATLRDELRSDKNIKKFHKRRASKSGE